MGRKEKVVTFRMPEGDTITVILVDLGDKGVIMEPVSANPNKVHHHAFEDSSRNWNLLIRDQYNRNIAAYVLDKKTGGWSRRPLTDAERRRR